MLFARISVLVLAAVACQREQPVKPLPVIRHPSSTSTQNVPAEAPKSAMKSTPQHCAGDGSYAAAVECIRIAAALRFKCLDGAGDMIRKTPGAEVLILDTNDGEWRAEAKASGVVWTHGGKAVKDVGQKYAKLWERLTVFPDPQKKEGAPKLSMEGNVRRYDFTDANTGDRYSVGCHPTTVTSRSCR